MNFLSNSKYTGFYHNPPNEKGSSPFGLPNQIPNQNHELIFDKLNVLLQKLCQKEPDLMATFILSNINFDQTPVSEKKALVSEYADLFQTKLQAQSLVKDILADEKYSNLSNQELLVAFISDCEGFKDVVLKITESINDPESSWAAIQELYENFEFIGKSIESTQAAGKLIQEYIKDSVSIPALIPTSSPEQPEIPVILEEQKVITQSPDVTKSQALDEQTTEAVKTWALGVSKYNKIPGLFAKGIISAELIATELKLTIELARSNIKNLLVAAQRSGLFEGFESKTRSGQITQLSVVFKSVLSPDVDSSLNQVANNPTNLEPISQGLPKTEETKTEPAKVGVSKLEARTKTESSPPSFDIVELPEALKKSFSLEAETQRVLVDDSLWDGLDIALSIDDLSCVVAIMNGLSITRAATLNYSKEHSEDEVISKICDFFKISFLGNVESDEFYDYGIKLGASLRYILFQGDFSDHINDVCTLRNKVTASDPAAKSLSRAWEINGRPRGKASDPDRSKRPRKVNLRSEFDEEVRRAEIERRRGESRSKRFD